MLPALSTYQLTPADCDGTELRAQAKEPATREKSLHEATDPTAAVLQDVELPPRLGILSFSTVGESPVFGEQIHAELVCENVGDDATLGVTAELVADACDAHRLSAVGTMAPRDRQTIMFDVPATAGDHVELAGTVAGDTAGTAEDTTTVVVRIRSAIVTSALESVTELQESLQACGKPSEQLRPLTTELTTAQDHLQRAQTALDRKSTARATNEIEPVGHSAGLKTVH